MNPPELKPEPSYRSPGSIIAILVIVGCVAWILMTAASQPEVAETEEETPDASADVTREMQFKMVLAVSRLSPLSLPQILDQTLETLETPADYRDGAALLLYLGDPARVQQASDLLDKIENPKPVDRILRAQTRAAPPLNPEEKELLETEMGWPGELVIATRDPELSATINRESQQLGLFIGIGTFAFLALGATGFALFVLAIVRKRSGQLTFRYQRQTRYGPYYLEAFAVYLATMILASLVLQLLLFSLQASTGMEISGMAFLAANLVGIGLSLILGIAWPRIRGVPALVARKELGLHTGKGVFREAMAGIVGYITLLPIVFTGFVIMLILRAIAAQISGDPNAAPTTHPIMGAMEGGWQAAVLILLLASVLVPITEEAMFRGALHRSLGSRFGTIVTLGVVAFVFAIIHPQGWLAVPVLMALAINFGLMREWRDSLIGPIVAHGLHNGTLLLMVILLLG